LSVKSGISAIANEVVGDVQKEAEALISAAEREAKETLRLAKEQADQSYQEILNKAAVKAEAEKRKMASVTEVEMRNRLLQTKEDLVDAAFEKAYKKLAEFVESKQYPEYLFNLVSSVAQKLGQQDLVVEVNAKDQELLTPEVLKRLSKKSHTELRLSNTTDDYLGGCKIHTVDDKIFYDATLDNRLQELKSSLRVEVAKKLFGEEA
jgi:vacuolar-type H+-ATPase subunit E/Vma4